MPPGMFQHELLTATDEQLATMMLQLPIKALGFANGRFPITVDRSRNDFVPINKIVITREDIHVSVGGRSKVAELIIADVIEWLWLAAGAQKNWDELQNSVVLASYGTGTIIDLGFPAQNLMNPTMTKFIETNMLGNQRYAADMGAASRRKGFAGNSTKNVMYCLDELHILFSQFDVSTGRSEECTLKFSSLSKDTRGSGVIFVASQLPYDKHVACLQEFINVMNDE